MRLVAITIHVDVPEEYMEWANGSYGSVRVNPMQRDISRVQKNMELLKDSNHEIMNFIVENNIDFNIVEANPHKYTQMSPHIRSHVVGIRYKIRAKMTDAQYSMHCLIHGEETKTVKIQNV